MSDLIFGKICEGGVKITRQILGRKPHLEPSPPAGHENPFEKLGRFVNRNRIWLFQSDRGTSSMDIALGGQ